MREKKRCWNDLNLYDYRGVEARLNAMAAKGWRLEKAGPQIWTYRRAEPARVHYAVTYIQDASQFNPGPTERQLTLEELCAAAGWEKVCDWYQMQIFVSEEAEPVPLETDEALRLEVVHRSMKKNFLPGNVVLLLFSLLMAVLWGKTLATDPIRLFENNGYLFVGPLWILAAVLEIFSLGSYWLWRRRSAKSVAEGGACSGTGTVSRRVNRAGMAVLVIYCAGYLAVELISSSVRYLGFLAAYFALMILLGFLVRRTTAFLRRRGASWGKNVAGTIAVDIILALILMVGLSWAVIHFHWFGRTGGGETYRLDHMEWDVSPMEIPLTSSDLTGAEYAHIRRWSYESGSFFLSRRHFSEMVRSAEAQVWISSSISYEITETKSAWLYGKVLEESTKEEIATPWDVTWETIDAAPWGAEAAYRRYLDGDAVDTYLLCFPGRLVEVDLDEEPTEVQMQVVGEKLRGG